MELADGVDVAETVGEGKRLGIVENVGKVTSTQRSVTFEATQQESVALGELAAQNPHRPWRLFEYPQLLGSFSSPSIQAPLNESAGRAQFVKSARIWET